MRGDVSPMKKANSPRKPLPTPPPRQGKESPKPIPVKSSNEDERRLSRPKARHQHLEESKIDLELGDMTAAAATKSATSTTSSAAAAAEQKEDRNTPKSPTKSGENQLAARKAAGASARFKGLNPLQYGMWAHYLAIGSGFMCICMGIFAMAWTGAETYQCKLNGDKINSVYLPDSITGVCSNTFTTSDGTVKTICCDPSKETTLEGYFAIGIIYLFYGFFCLCYENTSWGFGLWFPNDTIFFRNKISPIGILHFIIGLGGIWNYATCIAAVFLLITGVVYSYAVSRNESGDGGREAARRIAEAKAKEKEKMKNEDAEKTTGQIISEKISHILSFNPFTFYRRIYNEDKLSSYVWLSFFVIGNLIAFLYTLNLWYGIVDKQIDSLKDGSLDVHCNDRICHVNRKIVRYGPFSPYAAWAKACGMCLNLNGALLLLPVVKLLLRKLNNWGEQFATRQQQSDFCGYLFARPLTRYIPLSKNIEFHRIVAWTIFFFAWAHMIFHWINLYYANNATLRLFRLWGWDGTDYLTGALVSLAMFFIFTAAIDSVKWSKFEIFFKSHHFFTLFYIAMFLHGPNFFYWTCLPVLLYITERYLQLYHGNKPFVVSKVEFIPPVMALYFRPVFKEDFQFKEGQYLYLNCPFISASEWHPFTISSAVDDLSNGPRIHLETGEEVYDVPRPKNLPPNMKWNKYCLVSQDYTTMDPNEYLEKSETGYNDYVSLHIKVLGLEEVHARTWTRKLKEYFELMSPGKKFPFYFHKRDNRGEITIGRQFGPDGKTAILRVDGPHAAPAEHYQHYGTLMLIGAGIGLTPCVSILTSLTKYRWKKNFNPELLHFYWIIRSNEIESFQWLVHLLTDLSFELKKSRLNNQIEKRYYCEINIFITAYDAKNPNPNPAPLYRAAKKKFSQLNVNPSFTADELYAKMLNPTVTSKDMIKKMKGTSSQAVQDNRLQDIWIWNGRPNWDEIFAHMKEQRQHSDIGVCFCGAPVIRFYFHPCFVFLIVFFF
jgi:ferredoxin-NADP reductase